jgi:hypothetical protein
LQCAAWLTIVRDMARNLDEAQENYRAADEVYLAARKVFRETPGTNADERRKTAENLDVAAAHLKDATSELARWVTGKGGKYTGDIKIVG